MPQLMPLFWVLSMFMIMFLLLVMVDLFFFKSENGFVKSINEMKYLEFNSYKW